MHQAIASRIRTITPETPQGQALRIVPIAGPSHDEPTYRLLEADTLSAVKVTETSHAGSVPELLVENGLNVRVFLMDGQELVGAKQNRILNTDVLVPAKTMLKIPVSCVEQGRWNHVSVQFSPGKAASHRTRAGKARRVLESLRLKQTHDADQQQVWAEVAETLACVETESATMALNEAYKAREQECAAFRRSLQMPPDTVGLAVFHGSRFRGLDLFDRQSTLQYFWESLIDSYAIDWLSASIDPGQDQDTPASQTVHAMLQVAAESPWESFPSPGEGVDWRMDQPTMTGAALLWQEQVLLHLQLFPRDDAQRVTRRPRIHRRYGDEEHRVY